MDNQDDMNRGIASSLDALGIDRLLLWVWWHDEGQFEGEPRDFTDPRYLLPALEAWRKKDPYTRRWRIESAESGIESPDGITPERKDYGTAALIGDHLYMCDDLDRDPIAWAAECFADALGVGA